MIAISMRMTRQTYPSGDTEIRDALSHDWWRFLKTALPGTPSLPVPNIGPQAVEILNSLPVTGLILSGGDDWGIYPERDATETTLFTWARERKIPVIGVCRGAQVINSILGGRVRKGFGHDHSCARHAIRIEKVCPVLLKETTREVNSYHSCGMFKEDLAHGLRPWATTEDGCVEAFESGDGLSLGLMWHPEREARPAPLDIELFHRLSGE